MPCLGQGLSRREGGVGLLLPLLQGLFSLGQVLVLELGQKPAGKEIKVKEPIIRSKNRTSINQNQDHFKPVSPLSPVPILVLQFRILHEFPLDHEGLVGQIDASLAQCSDA